MARHRSLRPPLRPARRGENWGRGERGAEPEAAQERRSLAGARDRAGCDWPAVRSLGASKEDQDKGRGLSCPGFLSRTLWRPRLAPEEGGERAGISANGFAPPQPGEGSLRTRARETVRCQQRAHAPGVSGSRFLGPRRLSRRREERGKAWCLRWCRLEASTRAEQNAGREIRRGKESRVAGHSGNEPIPLISTPPPGRLRNVGAG